MTWLLAIQIPAMAMAFWLFMAYITQTFPVLRGRRICLLIAHPDDEAMFFAPTVQWLTQPHLANRVFILCLSSGNADGLGATRQQELIRSAAILGIGRDATPDGAYITENIDTNPILRNRVIIVDDQEHLPDSMTATWDPTFIASLLTDSFVPSKVSRTSSTLSPPTTNIDALITFDARGVSGHPNHIALYHGAIAFIQRLAPRSRAGWDAPVKLYTLRSVPVWRKYAGVFDSAWTLLQRSLIVSRGGETADQHSTTGPTPLVVVVSPATVRKAQRAMTDAHQSQMRWFRWGWIVLSRYMYVNDLTRENISK